MGRRLEETIFEGAGTEETIVEKVLEKGTKVKLVQFKDYDGKGIERVNVCTDSSANYYPKNFRKWSTEETGKLYESIESESHCTSLYKAFLKDEPAGFEELVERMRTTFGEGDFAKMRAKTDLNKVIEIMEPYLRKEILQALGSRKMGEKDLEELTIYWVASTVTDYNLNLFRKEGLDLRRMTDQEVQEFFLSEGISKWNRGLEAYSKMAGMSLSGIIEDMLRKKKKVNVLDIGCGQAVFLRDLQKKYGEKVGCYGVSNINQTGTETIKFRRALAEVLPEKWTNKFDLVTCFEASMYFWDQNRAFEEALRVTKPYGRLFYGTNNLKTYTNDLILEERLHLRDFSYTCPETSARAGEKWSGVFGKYISNFIPFIEGLKTLTDDCGIFKNQQGKYFKLDEAKAICWCTLTLQVRGMGYDEKDFSRERNWIRKFKKIQERLKKESLWSSPQPQPPNLAAQGFRAEFDFFKGFGNLGF